MAHRKYELDPNTLQYRQIKTPRSKQTLRLIAWFSFTLLIAVVYGTIFNGTVGSPKEKILTQEIEKIKLQYTVANKNIDDIKLAYNDLRTTDEIRYRPILQMEELPESYRNPGIGGTDRHPELNGFANSYIMKSTMARIDEMNTILEIQKESFDEMVVRESEWERMLDHIPSICPVLVTIRKGDGLMLRKVHPVLGVTKYHNGLDLSAPIGTEVFAPGDGQIVHAGWNGGYGKCVIIDHGYGYRTIYGHLSDIKVAVGQNIKRGDLISLTGNTGISTGPHLHYEIRQYDTVRNPLNYIHENISEDEYEEMIRVLGAQD